MTAARRVAQVPVLLVFMLVELVRANALVAVKVLGPLRRMHAVVLEVPIRARPGPEADLLTALLSLTPGTLPLEVDHERAVIVLHVLHARTAGEVHRDVRRVEDRVLAVLR